MKIISYKTEAEHDDGTPFRGRVIPETIYRKLMAVVNAVEKAYIAEPPDPKLDDAIYDSVYRLILHLEKKRKG